jgi:O-antigen/teichoic acid export membrane protein
MKETTVSGGSTLAHRAKYMMLIATAARMGVGLISFVLMARYLGPEQFGLLAAAIAFSALAATLSDFGLGISSLRAMAADPAHTAILVRRMMAAKLVVATLLASVYAAGVVALVDANNWPLFGFVLIGQIGFSVADLSMVPLRVHGRFGTEALVTVGASVAMLGLLSVFVFVTRDATATAGAFAIGRLIYAAAALYVTARKLRIRPIGRVPHRDVTSTLHKSRGYALDSSLGALSTQIDVPLFGLALTAMQLGIYQAGGRLVQVIVPFAVVLANVYLPALATSYAQGNVRAFVTRARSHLRDMIAMATVVGVGFALLGPLVGRLLYPPSYGPLTPLWTGFSVIVLAFGAALLAMGLHPSWAAMILAASSFAMLLILAMPSLRKGQDVRSNAMGLMIVLTIASLIFYFGDFGK